MAPTTQLPKAPSPDAVVSLSLLSGGHIHLAGEEFVHGATETLICPSMAWLLTHRATGANLLFDLGLRKDAHNYIPPVAERIRTGRVTISVPEDVFDSLARARVDPATDVDAVIFSHLHYDHVGDPGRFCGERTRFVVGPGTVETVLSGPRTYPADGGSIFDSNLLPRERTVELPFPSSAAAASTPAVSLLSNGEKRHWEALGPFPAAMDYFGDGSVFIVNAPGHLAGHLNMLVRAGVAGVDGDGEGEKWMYLAGDTAHDVRVYKGTRELAVYPDPKKAGHWACAHADKEAAHEHLLRVRKLDEEEAGVEVVLSHDFGWFEEQGPKWMV
ncbi:hypothetical protein GX51_04006 [Blastomyces parvus]|uniref:Metallo-beta-lactamase domain-containing protein n=1 Tax=Blastomyces parvus TaxID=2060905 RepID=A0A2B7X3Z2_9EURO|nr:hypothetical protein GX51_04006 [Blastomyces parvus]